MQIIALEPPGNVARDLARYRRELFSLLGEGSALAFPELVPLAFRSLPGKLPPGALRACWEGIDGAFGSAAPLLSRGLLYLAISGPVAELSARATAAFGGTAFGDADLRDAPLEPGIGVFLCRPSDPDRGLREALGIGPPRVVFRDCSLLLLNLRLGSDPLAAATWRERARARRRTGRSAKP